MLRVAFVGTFSACLAEPVPHSGHDRMHRSRRLGLMESSAFLINVPRAEIVEEDALYEALAQRSIAGAALDFWYRYPRQPGPTLSAMRPFHELPNVLMIPHVSGWTGGMLEARAKLIAENVRRVAHGETPLSLAIG